MPRYFAPIAPKDLQVMLEAKLFETLKKLHELDEMKFLQERQAKGEPLDCPWLIEVTPQVYKDLQKCKFDTENFAIEGYGAQAAKHCGYRTLPNGMAYLGAMAGGDWESPVFFIIYWDGKALRGYIPEDGNPWNTTAKAAYGNDSESDLENAIKRGFLPLYAEEFETGDMDFDFEKIVADIQARILPRGAAHKVEKEEAQRTIGVGSKVRTNVPDHMFKALEGTVIGNHGGEILVRFEHNPETSDDVFFLDHSTRKLWIEAMFTAEELLRLDK